MAINKRKSQNKIYKESLAYLIEDVMEKTDVVRTAEVVTDKLTDMAQDLSEIEAKDIIPILDSIATWFGQEVSDQFNKIATDCVRSLMTAAQEAKSRIDREIRRMEQGVEGGDMSDMGMDALGTEEPSPTDDMGGDNAPMPTDQNNTPEKNKLPELPSQGKDDLGFAGREKKEGFKRRGKMIKENMVEEDFLDAPKGKPEPAIDQHPHKSQHFDLNIHNLSMFHGGAVRLARNIEVMIDSERLSGTEREKLSNVLSHFAAFASEPSHWSDAEAKLASCLKEVKLIGDAASRPEVAGVISELRKLAHLIAHKHNGLMESAIKSLRESSDPDSLVLTTFRKKLAEGYDAQMSAIRTARLYAIDIEDVVSIVKEAAAHKRSMSEEGRVLRTFNKPCQKCGKKEVPFGQKCPKCGTKQTAKTGEKKPVKEFKMNTPDSAKGMFKGKNVADLDKRRSKDKNVIKKDEKEGKGHAEKSKDLKRTNFAIRAKKSKDDKGWNQKVSEDNVLLQNAPMFPVNAGGGQTGGNQFGNNQYMNQTGTGMSQSGTNGTQKPMTPADSRMQQSMQTSNQQGNAALNTPGAPTGNNTMVPPGETDSGGTIPPNGQRKMAPVQSANKPMTNMPAGKIVKKM